MVYIGTRKYKYGRMIMSHMVADSLDELHNMAQFIGIPQKYFQNKKGKPHYDVSQVKKRKALALGAKEVNDRQIIKVLKNFAES
jgi:hypothetical protein